MTVIQTNLGNRLISDDRADLVQLPGVYVEMASSGIRPFRMEFAGGLIPGTEQQMINLVIGPEYLSGGGIQNARAGTPRGIKCGFQMGDRQVLITLDAQRAVDFVTKKILQGRFHSQYARVEPFVPILPEGVINIEMIIDYTVVIETSHAPMVVAEIITKRQVRR